MATTKSDTGHSREIVGLKKIRESVFVCKDVNRGKKRAADRLCRVSNTVVYCYNIDYIVNT